ncbi:MAG: hypothetical protein ABI992_05860 [Chthoniobacterales bacterium]
MINLLSSTLVVLPDLPSFSRRRVRPRVAALEKHRANHAHCRKEINRWVGRWENEGGAIGEKAEAKAISDRRARKKNAGYNRATGEITPAEDNRKVVR